MIRGNIGQEDKVTSLTRDDYYLESFNAIMDHQNGIISELEAHKIHVNNLIANENLHVCWSLLHAYRLRQRS